MQQIRNYATKFLFEILVFIISATSTCLVSLRITSAEHEIKIKNTETVVEKMYRENREDHQELKALILGLKK